MSNFSRDPILLTPGPLTTSLATKTRDAARLGLVGFAAFNAVTADVRRAAGGDHRRRPIARLRADAGQRHVLGRGRGQHARAARRPRAGADQRRLRHAHREAHADDGAQASDVRDRRGRADDRRRTSTGCSTPTRRSRTSGLIHCETSTGILNPLREIAAVVARHGRRLIVDAMSSFAAIADRRAHDAVRRADRGVGQVRRGPARDGLRLRPPQGVLEHCAGNSTSLALDLHDQWTYMERTTQWRYTPPTHVVVALQRGARPARSRKAASRRGSRATRGTARRSSPAWRSSASGRS